MKLIDQNPSKSFQLLEEHHWTDIYLWILKVIDRPPHATSTFPQSMNCFDAECMAQNLCKLPYDSKNRWWLFLLLMARWRISLLHYQQTHRELRTLRFHCTQWEHLVNIEVMTIFQKYHHLNTCQWWYKEYFLRGNFYRIRVDWIEFNPK